MTAFLWQLVGRRRTETIILCDDIVIALFDTPEARQSLSAETYDTAEEALERALDRTTAWERIGLGLVATLYACPAPLGSDLFVRIATLVEWTERGMQVSASGLASDILVDIFHDGAQISLDLE